MSRSQYDELHDRYHRLLTTKAGTRYERLAAVVFAAMERDGVVVHDVSLRGEVSEVAHQIDVQVEKDGASRRVLVECKDFDVSGEPVGLEIVKSFYAVVADVRPDEAWIITCNGFTRGARQFAKAMGIRLATLRVFGSADWENRVQTILVNLTITSADAEHPNVTFVMDADDLRNFVEEFGDGPLVFAPEDDPTFVYDGTAQRPLGAIIQDVASRVPPGWNGPIYGEGIEFDGWISGPAGRRYALRGIRVDVPVYAHRIELRTSAAQEAARLLLTDGAGLDFVLWEDALQGFTIDDAGEVHLSDTAVQKRLIQSVKHLP